MDSKSELDNHANIVVTGLQCVVFDDTTKTCTVNSFSESVGRLDNIRIVDIVMAYDCPYKSKTYLLLMRNTLHIPELPLNLIPPFIMREGGIIVDECPKSQLQNLSVENHSMWCEDAKLRIHFELNGIFSSFQTRKPTDHELEVCDKIFITPDSTSWDPYSENFAVNEDTMLDCNGDLIDLSDRHDAILTQVDPYYDFPSTSTVDSHIDKIVAVGMDNIVQDRDLNSIDNKSLPNYEAHNIADKLLDKALMGKISAALGVMSIDEECANGEPLFTTTLDEMEMKCQFQSEISALEAGAPFGTTPEFLKKIWSISDKESNAVLEANTHLNRQSNEGQLSRHFSTNDRMLRYRRIDSYLFTDTLLVTKSAKSIRGYLYLQVFVSDKGFIAVYLMELKSEFKDALHSFCKEVGVPVALVVDPSGE